MLVATVSQGSVEAFYLVSMLKLFTSVWREKLGLDFAIAQGSYIAEQRDVVARGFLSSPNEWLMFIDSDVVFLPGDLVTLLETAGKKLPMVSALAVSTFRGTRTRSPTAWADAAMTEPVDTSGRTPMPVAVCGFEFVLIRRALIEAVFREHGCVFETGRDEAGFVGDDVLFCRRARALGFAICVDRAVRVGHRKHQTLYPKAAL